MDVYPQIFDRQQTLILKPLIGHARLGGQRAGEPPGAFPAHADRNSGSQIRSELCQLTNLGATVTPLFPVAHAHPAAQPVVYFRDWSIMLRFPKVAHPAAQVLCSVPP